MPTKRTSKTPSAKPATAGKVSDMTLGDVLKRFQNVKANQLTVVALIVAVFFVGFLLGKLQGVDGGVSKTTTTAAAAPQQGDLAAAPQAPSGPVDVTNGNLPVKGDEDAPVTIVEFSDFECPFCGQFYNDTLPQLLSEYVDTGKVKIYYRHLPLSFHPQARPAALASECANDQGAFWEFHDKVFENQTQLTNGGNDIFVTWAGELGLDTDDFRSCLEEEKFAENVDGDLADAAVVGASGTPTFYVNGLQIVGAQPFSAFQQIIDQELEKSS